ncbi:MAG: protease modulator HflK [Planctomycetota bacterium]
MNVSSRKARKVSLIAFILSLIFFVFTLALGAAVKVLAMYLMSWVILAGAMVWLILVLQFHQRVLAEQEKLDMSQLAKSDQQGTIFSGGADRMALMAVAQKRLVFLEKWVVPIASAIIAVYQILIGLWLFKLILDPTKALDWQYENPLLGAFLMAGVAFFSFLFSRFATGMSSEKQWKPLRGGGSYLLLTAVLGFAIAVSLGFAQFKHAQGLVVMKHIIPWVLVVLGIEILLNSILDFYRPRVAGEYNRAPFDSRILGIFNEPGGMMHTIAHTIDYQFGFKVSQTWFYQLLGKAIMPLILLAMLILYLMSSVVVIGPGQAGVIENFGAPVRDEGPGLHFKWPWPIEIAYMYPTDEIQQLSIGYKEGEEDKNRKAFLWGEKHFEEEYDLLVAVKTDTESQDESAVPVSIVQASVPIQYRISNMRQYLYNHKEAAAMLEAICYRELTRFAVSANIDTDAVGGAQDSLLGPGRLTASKTLKSRIQTAADEAQLGVEIVFLGLQGVHPPAEVAKEYEQVIASVQQKQATVLAAQAERNKILTELAGSIEAVDALYELAGKLEAAKQTGDDAAEKEIELQFQASLKIVKGKVFKALRAADSYAFEKVNQARGEGLQFAGQVKSYQAAPEIYKKIQRLKAMAEGLEKARKYVVVVEDDDTQIYQVDLQEKLTRSLYDLDLGLQGEE